MKQPLPPSIRAALADVERIADDLAATACESPAGKFNGMSVAACLDNLDQVAAALTWKELEQAPAMLNAVARAFRIGFPSDSLGWDDAGRLQTIASMIAHWQTLPDNGSGTI
jgi:hypothetical protein